jgi:branched-chain amino acid transport system ATP-binding protein
MRCEVRACRIRSRPKLLLLDEPSLGLAPLLVPEIMALVQKINAAGTTVLLVEQNARQALRIAHRAYILEKGRIVGRDERISYSATSRS